MKEPASRGEGWLAYLEVRKPQMNSELGQCKDGTRNKNNQNN